MPLTACLFALTTLAVSPAAADDAAPRVRVTSHIQARLGAAPVVGRLLASANGLIVVQPDRGPRVELPEREVFRLEYRQPRSRGRGALRGAGIGFAAGAAAGVAAGLGAGDDSRDPNCWFYCSRKDRAMLGTVLLAPLGAAVGGVVGALQPGEGWCSRRPELNVGVAPVPGGMRAEAGLRF